MSYSGYRYLASNMTFDLSEKLEGSDDGFDVHEARDLVTTVNRKKKRSGGFQSMGLSPSVFNGIIKKGYKIPTPIQRKAIPLLLAGCDVVAMARTGSGKTAAFLIPLFEKFQSHSPTGPRALIISPTREIALQTLKFTKEIGKFTPLKATVILGGDKMEEQFAAIHKCPDIVIATPGRLLHVMVEMNLSLKTIEYVVFDEGDRLFELGFAEQLSETLKRLPRARQTLIFSATLPKSLVEFSRAGLVEPILLRLDVDTKLSKGLKLAHIFCLPNEKTSVLLYMVKQIISSKQQVVVFFATKHHVEYFLMLITDFGFNTTCIHSGLDPAARNLALKQFRSGKKAVLLVTDVAARGVDIPHLDNVINYHFPTQPKLFLHRVGRVARAGRSGIAYSLFDTDELPYLLDVYMFLGKKWELSRCSTTNEKEWTSDCVGRAPRSLTHNLDSRIKHICSENVSLDSIDKVCINAMKKFLLARPKASAESVRRAKQLKETLLDLPVHDIFDSAIQDSAEENEILSILRGLKLPTIFETLGKSLNPQAYATATKVRQLHNPIIQRRAAQKALQNDSHLKALIERKVLLSDQLGTCVDDTSNLEHLELFIPYSAKDETSERSLSINSSSNQFVLASKSVSLDIQSDEPTSTIRSDFKKRQMVWDRRRKRFISSDAAEGRANMKRIKTESGIWIPASYKTDKYKQWLKNSKADVADIMQKQEMTLELPDQQPSDNIKRFSSKYGAVIEFPDLSDVDKRNSNTSHNQKSDRSTKKSNNLKPQFSVINSGKWYERANSNQKEREANRLTKEQIRQPKGSRTFGQLRKPEQVLKRRKLRAKQLGETKPSRKSNHSHNQNLKRNVKVVVKKQNKGFKRRK